MALTPVVKDKVVLVTGAGSGLGRAYALHAARSGATVGINDIDPDRAEAVSQEAKGEGLAALALVGDMSEWDVAGSLVGRMVSEFGRIDGLVSNAGIFYTCLPWEDSPEAITRLVKTNLLGVMFGGIHAMRFMVEQGWGSIVNITSGSQLGLTKMGAYGASKGGVASATYSWAIDLKGTGVRANAVSPLAVTNMGTGNRSTPGNSRPPLPHPDHVAPLVTYLLSDLSQSVNGQVLRLEGPLLSILHHPSIPELQLNQEDWTVEEIAAAVDGPLAKELRHVGRDSGGIVIDPDQVHAAPSVEHGLPLESDPLVVGRPLTLGLFLTHIAARDPDHEAIVTPSHRITYGGLLDRSLSIARGLVAKGAGKGSRVAIFLPNGPDWVASFFGVTLVGAIAVALNTFARGEDLEYMLTQSDSQFLISSTSMTSRLTDGDLLGRHPLLQPGRGTERDLDLPALLGTFHLDDGELVRDGERVTTELICALAASVTPEDDALIMFTSGSTGRPKVVLHVHQAVCIPSWRWWHLEERSPADRIFSTSPFFWSSGLTRTLGGTLAAGATLVLQEHFEPGQALDLLERERVTSVLSRPHLDHRLVDHPDFDSHDLSSVKRTYEDSPLGLRLGLRHRGRNGYGMTETMTLVSQTPLTASPDEPGSGLVLPGMSVRIIDPASGLVLPRNTPGRICVRGATLMRGYCKRPRKEVFDEEGYFLTSDAGLLDDEGRLHWTGRLDNMAKVVGANVYPIEVERQLSSLGRLLAFSIFSLPHPTLGSALVLWAAPATDHDGSDPPVDESAIREHLQSRLASYQMPRRILLVNGRELSFTPTQKVDIKVMRRLAIERMLEDDVESDWAAYLRELRDRGELASVD